jgi:hypothetical protein
VDAYGTDQWPDALGRLLRENYPALFGIDLAAASPAQFNERYRSAFQGGEQVQRKSMTFFLNAAREAQIEISPHILKNKKPRSASVPIRRRVPRSPTSSAATVSSRDQTLPLTGEAVESVVAAKANGGTRPKEGVRA